MKTMELAEVAAILAEPARATMCLALIDGRAWTVGELARTAGVAPSTGSEHVSKLVEAGFVEALRQGRHSYVRITDPDVADLIEHLSQHAAHPPRTGLRASLQARRLATARTCYDHLAGKLGVALRDGMRGQGLIDDRTGLTLTPTGAKTLTSLGIPLPHPNGRPQLRDGLDWTERREHLAGAIPAALLHHALESNWLHRNPDRSLHHHPTAHTPFTKLGVDLEALISEKDAA
ncbi:MAG TPA: helix-turn-helix domain-containing protein [Actinophytocola sp.]|uniref:ArsR/SmtB family transcription factor n=1 Tax=Actinophytocola sp. TaxID=1872138 RepID=UPI002E09DD0D|nr:helix-turn-helix domain-containing protein [Actinophytocola sp.]